MLPASGAHLVVAAGLFLAAALVAYRRRAWTTLRLQAVVAIAAATGVVSLTRISEAAIWYLIRWSWVIAMWWWVSIGWSLLPRFRRGRSVASTGLACAALAVSISALGSANGHSHDGPDQAAVRAMAPAMVREVPPPGPVLVEAITPKIWPVAVGLELQLEKHGVRVAAPARELVKYGQRRVDQAADATRMFVVAAGESVESLRQLAVEKAPLGAEVQLVSSWSNAPRRWIAVFGYAHRVATIPDPQRPGMQPRAAAPD